jgi:protoheme IX farnesyltransferase
MAIAVNLLAGALLLLAILYYVLIYTMWLKRSTPQNIVIGGGAGAFPPMIGWAAVTGNVTLEPIILFTLIFFWTPPHFWALSLYKAEDYSKAGVPMLPVVKGVGETKKQILIYTFLLAIIAMLPAYLGMSGIIYLISAILLNAFFIYYAISTYYNINRAPATFGFSILYLFLLFGSLMVDKIYFYHLF